MQVYLIQKVLVDYAEQYMKEVRAQLKKYNKNATGGTSGSLMYRIDITDDGVGLIVSGAKAFLFIEQGRRAGAKMPPAGSLLQWLAARSIPKRLEYVIRRNIGIRGIKPTPILQTARALTIKDLSDKINSSIAASFREGVIVNTKRIF